LVKCQWPEITSSFDLQCAVFWEEEIVKKNRQFFVKSIRKIILSKTQNG